MRLGHVAEARGPGGDAPHNVVPARGPAALSPPAGGAAGSGRARPRRWFRRAVWWLGAVGVSPPVSHLLTARRPGARGRCPRFREGAGWGRNPAAPSPVSAAAGGAAGFGRVWRRRWFRPAVWRPGAVGVSLPETRVLTAGRPHRVPAPAAAEGRGSAARRRGSGPAGPSCLLRSPVVAGLEPPRDSATCRRHGGLGERCPTQRRPRPWPRGPFPRPPGSAACGGGAGVCRAVWRPGAAGVSPPETRVLTAGRPGRCPAAPRPRACGGRGPGDRPPGVAVRGPRARLRSLGGRPPRAVAPGARGLCPRFGKGRGGGEAPPDPLGVPGAVPPVPEGEPPRWLRRRWGVPPWRPAPPACA